MTKPKVYYMLYTYFRSPDRRREVKVLHDKDNHVMVAVEGHESKQAMLDVGHKLKNDGLIAEFQLVEATEDIFK